MKISKVIILFTFIILTSCQEKITRGMPAKSFYVSFVDKDGNSLITEDMEVFLSHENRRKLDVSLEKTERYIYVIKFWIERFELDSKFLIEVPELNYQDNFVIEHEGEYYHNVLVFDDVIIRVDTTKYHYKNPFYIIELP